MKGGDVVPTFVLHVATGKEDEVKDALESFPLTQTFHFWVPKRPIHKKKQGLVWLRYEALFPGYVLADGDDFVKLYKALIHFTNEYFYTLLEKRGEGGKTVTQEEKKIIGKLTGEISQGILEDGRVKFIAGELMGMEGSVQKFDKRKSNVLLRMELLGEMTDIWTAVDMVDKI